MGGLLEVSYHGTSTTNCFLAYDGNGNVAALINAADGTVAANYEYGPFGEAIRMTGPMSKANPCRFSTKYDDDESDLLYYGYRFYKPSTGTWPNRDPLHELGFEVLLGKQQITTKDKHYAGIFHKSKPLNPEEKASLYVFVDNDPLGRIDPYGLNWSTTAEAIWTALGYIVPGSEIPAAAMAAPDCAKIAIITKFKNACIKCNYNPPDSDPNCKICEEWQEVVTKLH